MQQHKPMVDKGVLQPNVVNQVMNLEAEGMEKVSLASTTRILVDAAVVGTTDRALVSLLLLLSIAVGVSNSTLPTHGLHRDIGNVLTKPGEAIMMRHEQALVVGIRD